MQIRYRPEIKFKIKRCQCLSGDKENISAKKNYVEESRLIWVNEAQPWGCFDSQFMQKIFTSHHHQWFLRINRNNNPSFGRKISGFWTKSKLSDSSGWKVPIFYRHVPHLFRLHCLWRDLSASLLLLSLKNSPMKGKAGGPGIFSIRCTNRDRLRL